MIHMGIDDIAEVLGGTIITGREPVDISDLEVRTVSSDSREQVRDGLFVAIAGERVDGHRFLNSAQEHGFVAALVDHEVADSSLLQIEVDDTVAALGRLARHNIDLRRASGKPFSLVGITGSVGKTTTKDITKTLLGELGPTVAPVGSFNNELGLPLTALKVEESTRYFVAEMGANHLGEIRGLTAIAPPDISVVLKVGTAHLGEFGSVENIFIAKSEIVEALAPEGTALLNSDDLNVVRMQERTKAAVRWFGLETEAPRELAVSATDIEMDDEDRASFTLLLHGEPSGRVHLGIQGEHNVINALAAVSIAVAEGMKPEAIVAVLNSGVALSPHRMAVSTVNLENTVAVENTVASESDAADTATAATAAPTVEPATAPAAVAASAPTSAPSAQFTLVDDSFNANPDSMKSGIEGLMGMHRGKAYHVALLGPMLELGENSAQLHEQVGAYAVKAGANAVISVGLNGEAGGEDLAGLATSIAKGALAQASVMGSSARIVRVESLKEAEREVGVLASSHPDTVVLLKGSHASGLGQLALKWAQGDARVTPAPQESATRTTAMTTATDGE